MALGGRLRCGLLIGALMLVAGCGQASVDDAMAAYRKGDYATAVALFQPLAEGGDASAQVALGLMHDNGQGVARDYGEAVKWYRLAADRGSADGQAALGAMYDNGHGVEQDDAEAVKWFRLAARQGDEFAQYNLGVLYKNGRGVPQDNKRAYLWFNIAAAKGQQEAIEKRDLAAANLNAEEVAQGETMARKCEQASFRDCN